MFVKQMKYGGVFFGKFQMSNKLSLNTLRESYLSLRLKVTRRYVQEMNENQQVHFTMNNELMYQDVYSDFFASKHTHLSTLTKLPRGRVKSDLMTGKWLKFTFHAIYQPLSTTGKNGKTTMCILCPK